MPDFIPDELETSEGRKAVWTIAAIVVILVALALVAIVVIANIFDVNWLQSIIVRLMFGDIPTAKP